MISLSWDNPLKICLFSIPALKISQGMNQFQSPHSDQVVVSLFKVEHTQLRVNEIQLSAHTTWPLRDLLDVWLYNSFVSTSNTRTLYFYLSAQMDSIPVFHSIWQTLGKLPVNGIAWSRGHIERLRRNGALGPPNIMQCSLQLGARCFVRYWKSFWYELHT